MATLTTTQTPAKSRNLGVSPSPLSNEEAARFLLQAQFSAAPDDIGAVKSQGLQSWLAAQLAQPPSTMGFDWLTNRGYAEANAATTYYDQRYPADYMLWSQLIGAPDAVRKRLALALSEFFVVSLQSLDFAWRSHAAAAYWDVLNIHALGNFRQLLEAVSINAAMGAFLNTKGNQKENPATGRVPDENFAREVMQLFTIGLTQLNLDGSEQKAADGSLLDTYSAADVSGLARALTGWDFDNTQNVNTMVGTQRVSNTAFTQLPMRFNAANHSPLAATFLGTTIPAGTSAPVAGSIALDTLFNHPNVGPFFGRQMIQRLVTSNPSPAYVARVARAFNNNGAGVRGDLKAVWTAVLLDPEARSSAGLLANSNFGKLREPMLRLVQWARTFGVKSAQGSWKIEDLSNPATQLGQSPLRAPSVFNFFRPGYVPPSTALSASGTPAPEFQLVNESSVGGYLNYMQSVVRSGIGVRGPELAQRSSTGPIVFDMAPDYSAELAIAFDTGALLYRLNVLLCAGQLSQNTLQTIATALNATPLVATSPASAVLDRVASAVLLVMASSEYLVQK